jgi:hypothetical protein
MRSIFPPPLASRHLAASLALSSTLLTTGCVPHKVIRVLPPVTLSDTRTKRNLAVGQLFFEDIDGQLTAGPNLQSLGLQSHSVPLGPVSVSQPDITLAEFLNAIGGSSASCEAALPQQTSSQDGVDWFSKEKDTLVGEDVSLLLEDVSEVVADPKSLTQLFKAEYRRSGTGVPWAPTAAVAQSGTAAAALGAAAAPPAATVAAPNATVTPPSDHGTAPIAKVTYKYTYAVVQALYARQAVLRFRVPEKASLDATGTFFVGKPATTVADKILTLIKMASTCGALGHARELPDPGVEVNYAYHAPISRGATLVRDDHGRPDSLPPVEANILLYEQPRLPTPSFRTPRLEDSQPVWKVHTDQASAFLHKAKDQPLLDDNMKYLIYCVDGKCDSDAVITTAREFKVEDAHFYDNGGLAHGCVFGQSPRWWNLVHHYKAAVQREVALRELVLFFGSQPKDTAIADYSEDTSEVVHLASKSAPKPHSGPTTEAWIYEYDCQGGVVEPRPAGRAITNQGVYGHLKGWELNQ